MPRPGPVRPKRSIELNLYLEDIEWMEKMISMRRLPSSKSEIVSRAILELKERVG